MEPHLNHTPARSRLPKFVRIIRARPRLFTCALIGLIVIAATPSAWLPATRMLVGWNVGVGLYLVLVVYLMAIADVHHIRRRARLQDEGGIAILVLVAFAALASLGAIVALLGGATRDAAHLLLATLTIVLSWAFTHFMFALHYAHEFYDENGGKGGGMEFPGGEKEPDYWDFAY